VGVLCDRMLARARARRPPRLCVNLLLVPVGRLYRPPLRISQRTELATAFAQGQAERTSGRVRDEKHMQQMLELSADERSAYRLGLAGPDGLQAPARLAVALPFLLFECVVGTLARAPRRWRHKLALIAAYFPAVVYAQRVSERARVRRARALGLTAETAPRPGPLAVFAGQLLGRILLVCVQQVWVRHRTGRRPRVTTSSVVAAAAIRELRLRQDWNAAYKG
jgi:hypothetical protein